MTLIKNEYYDDGYIRTGDVFDGCIFRCGPENGIPTVLTWITYLTNTSTNCVVVESGADSKDPYFIEQREDGVFVCRENGIIFNVRKKHDGYLLSFTDQKNVQVAVHFDENYCLHRDGGPAIIWGSDMVHFYERGVRVWR